MPLIYKKENDYEAKLSEHLGDESTYEVVNSVPSKKLKTKINPYLKSLHHKKIISERLYWRLFSRCATIPLFYGLIKIHKENNPIRPIAAFNGSPSYIISQCLSQILTPITNLCDHKLRNSVDAREKL